MKYVVPEALKNELRDLGIREDLILKTIKEIEHQSQPFLIPKKKKMTTSELLVFHEDIIKEAIFRSSYDKTY